MFINIIKWADFRQNSDFIKVQKFSEIHSTTLGAFSMHKRNEKCLGLWTLHFWLGPATSPELNSLYLCLWDHLESTAHAKTINDRKRMQVIL